MLLNMTRKLCPLMTFILAIGCGKKIADPQTNDLSRSTQNQLPSNVLPLELDTSTGNRKTFILPRDGMFQGLPTALKVKHGDAAGVEIRIYYNVEDEVADEYNYQFHCNYKSSVSGTDIPLVSCATPDSDRTFSDVGDTLFPMDAGKNIQIELRSSNASPVVIDSIYNVDWR
jgi:hypothetical protein